MYQLLDKECSQQRVFSRECLADSREQGWLAAAHRQGASVFCLCNVRNNSLRVPLVVRQAASGYHLARRPGDASSHLPGCSHGEPPDFTASFGAPDGAFKQDADGILLDLQCLFAMEEYGEGSGGGQKLANFSAPMLSLLWLLHVQAGLHVALPNSPPRSLWKAYQSVARRIRVKVGREIVPLESMILFPESSQKNGAKVNIAKLYSATRRGSRVFFAFELPRERHAYLPKTFVRDPTKDPSLSLREIFGTPVWANLIKVERQLIGRYNHAYHHCHSGQSVVAFGSAKLKTPERTGKPYVPPSILHLAYLPIAAQSVPVPTAKHIAQLSEAHSREVAYQVNPCEDPILAEAIRLATFHRSQSDTCIATASSGIQPR